jgi:TorA maturation chaperone TorD
MLLLQLLGKVFYSLPDRDWFQSLIAEDTFADVPFAGAQPDVQTGLALLQAWSKGGLDDAAFKAVQIDYTRLFTGYEKMAVPPWESVYFSEERLTFQEETMDVRRWYGRFGLEVERLRQEPDDHIGLELTFMAHLAWRGLQCLEAGDKAGLERSLGAQRAFLSEHLLRWGVHWAGLAAETAQTNLYRGLALLTRGALLELAARFSLTVPEMRVL